MKLIRAILLICSISTYAQNPENLLNRNINPSLLSNFDTLLFYTSINIIATSFGLHESEIGTAFKLKKRQFQSSITQYGYKSFKESKLTISSVQKLSKSINIGLALNYNHIYISDSPNYNAISFDLGLGIKRERLELYVLLQNPYNSSYLENDIESRFSLNTRYYWNENLSSELNVVESLHTGLSINHRITYNYLNTLQLAIIQGVKPFEYGFILGYKKKKIKIFSQYYKYSFTHSTGFLLIYTLGDA